VYFTFLFLLRAVLKAEDFLRSYPYDTGNAEDAAQVFPSTARTTIHSATPRHVLPAFTSTCDGGCNAWLHGNQPPPLHPSPSRPAWQRGRSNSQ
jgi:hypothetical protein